MHLFLVKLQLGIRLCKNLDLYLRLNPIFQAQLATTITIAIAIAIVSTSNSSELDSAVRWNPKVGSGSDNYEAMSTKRRII
ncbi:hypothetical protein PHYBLDRAFT_145887 [Phycomyces blakesleeanus NRRL 1555(-)]|uniref:Uncharacterized protein n=1 Tax=Phycomyces blakesleeanus (strain ATCC 8743b / DSM 1359 / FGSC 10004 / NBRC 33097 / NRRL 1555) TaxID=763407 RepID=A0A167MQ07_PHYB8|nr:hypothetical protein PHYBLDRAFT_145887 [Phycomyces blakesleeanus NRRL 1555(-)]OAD73496.1 hypothetical protein PHYBLDRAFT_145887 [Phycomyces blakesleeanus NRRL 1555(-)]|eukprot:XP_018291536.1 hypothetical protein PHYBLDRAFT_145887 [Phycomyces blakesleeanus NRRL 1555(-)]